MSCNIYVFFLMENKMTFCVLFLNFIESKLEYCELLSMHLKGKGHLLTACMCDFICLLVSNIFHELLDGFR